MNIKQIGVLAKEVKGSVAPLLKELKTFCQQQKIKLIGEEWISQLAYLEEHLPRKKLASKSDLLVVLGGDGTLLSAVQSEGERLPPILGINLGKLGFLTENTKEELIAALTRILQGKHIISQRTCLAAKLSRQGKVLKSWLALNDLVINKGALARIIELKTKVNGQLMTSYRGDGMVIATPTGSTAYAMSAGGPIVCPDVPCIIISPICPHALSQRTMVINDSSDLTVEVDSAGEEIFLTIDGQRGHALQQGDLLQVRCAENKVKLISSNKHDHFAVLRQKLKWGER